MSGAILWGAMVASLFLGVIAYLCNQLAKVHERLAEVYDLLARLSKAKSLESVQLQLEIYLERLGRR